MKKIILASLLGVGAMLAAQAPAGNSAKPAQAPASQAPVSKATTAKKHSKKHHKKVTASTTNAKPAPAK